LPADKNVRPTGLVAVSSKSLLDLLTHGGGEHRGATEGVYYRRYIYIVKFLK